MATRNFFWSVEMVPRLSDPTFILGHIFILTFGTQVIEFTGNPSSDVRIRTRNRSGMVTKVR